MSHRSVFKKHVYRMNWMGISGWYGMRYTALSKNLLEIKNSQAFATGTALVVSVLFWHFFSIFGTFFRSFWDLLRFLCDFQCIKTLLSQAFATGTALAVSVLDSIMSTAYYNHQALPILISSISYVIYPYVILPISYVIFTSSYLILQSSGPDTYQKSHLWR